ncbi:polysaccharide deacetylase family protein [Morganella morganii subsp. morganii]|uniref:tail fiber/spike domain-containing protein n=1 Tax=Morganella morganii TaxID=582 RepID=UPI001BDA96AF|nr:polysaccharide deacetylase family protein [Morganella morganii]MBT0353126.1 polysaccharide deacetylase family protein [Morganella morganii subsp. morganii]
MTTIPTQNAVPSEAPRDLKFNSGKIDEFVTSLEHEYKDRFGRSHMTIEGMKWMFDQLVERFKVDINQAIIAAGYIPMDSFQLGAEITKRNEILRDETTGEYYRWDGDLPKSVPAGATPESSGGVGVGKWVGVGDASLRGDLARSSGAGLIGTESGGTVQAEINDLREDAKSTKRISAPCISFIFDDGKMSHVTVVAPLFRSYNLRCGFAINTEGLGLTDNMQGSDVISLSDDGFEIISHSYSAVNLGSQVNDTFVMAELSTAQSMFYEMGISPSIFQAPSSVVADEHMHIVDGFYSYAFTRSPSPLPMKNEHPTRLRRFGLETATGIISLDEAKSVVDDAVSKNGVIVFYAHDVPDGSDKKKLISDIIDYAITEGVSIVPPSSAVFSASKSQNLPSKMITMGDTILNELNGWVATNGTVQVTANKDIVVTASSPGSCLIQLPVGMKLTDNRGITFSAAFRNLRGSVSSASIGANIYSGSSVIRSVEKPITGLDAVYRRYSVSHVMPFNADRILSFFRVNFSATGDQVLIRAPVVRYGTSVNPDTHWKSFYDVDIVGGQTIPNSSSSYSRIKLTDSSSNGLFSVSENKISFDRPCTVSLSISVLANGANLSGNTGGVLRINVGSTAFNIPSSSGTNNAGASQSMTINVTTLGNIAFDMINTGSAFAINSLSSIRIQEI